MTEQTTKREPTSPTRPTHRITRSITEISPPILRTSSNRPHHLHHSSGHHHHYHHSRRARSSDKEGSAKREPQSAHPNIQSTDPRWREGVKSEFGTPAESRRASGAMWDIDVTNANTNATSVGSMGERRVVKEGEVVEEREKEILRATKMRISLTDLNTLSNDQTSRLDITYYSVLEKLAFLQSSLASLKEIASATRNTTVDFNDEAEDLVEEISEQVEAFDNFSSQERRIKDLTQRVKTGRGKINGLNQRVEIIRDKVEGYERKEEEWQNKTRRRLRVMWLFVSVVSVVLVGLVLFRYTPAKSFGPGVVHGVGKEGLRVGEGGLGNESWSLKREVGVGREGVAERLRKSQGERSENGEGDERLRVFDEL